ncbi:MAG: metal-sensitive transcriptional regulator [Chloroflexi bacterium]|nr:metal-sensitive transcriptional regulator [Chloroflexota bacterium]
MEAKKKTDLLRRVKIVSGHLKGVEKMIEEDVYCVKIIEQVQAIQAALNKVNTLILDDHLRHCVTTAVRGEDANERERVLSEIATVFETASKL